MKNSLRLLKIISLFATVFGIGCLNTGCIPNETDQPATNSADIPMVVVDLSTPRASFESLATAISSDDHASRLACLTTTEKNREAGVAALNLMQLAVKSPSDGDRFLKILDDHGLSQQTINRAMTSYGAGSVGMPGFTEKIGEKIHDLPQFHDKISKIATRPPIQELSFISATPENNQMLGRIKIGNREAVITFRQIGDKWLIDSPIH